LEPALALRARGPPRPGEALAIALPACRHRGRAGAWLREPGPLAGPSHSAMVPPDLGCHL